jgi:hypothetical protein
MFQFDILPNIFVQIRRLNTGLVVIGYKPNIYVYSTYTLE